ncbi:hypothetical protein SYNPS1DRAFT_28540 [Syncephalis pseudoplumigaleata]|uniref:F-box domain-containing protein n=1 Tax=Syncephalis pseudoplumigaleata TaxID=1712513 RepID=A0A4P9Z0D2_9FUNG|nr:hypothetical protein SYNPS1DRAFT_28540 [Syncephalis pseudoplumigaleata]|eukprot:RKP25738.1 hypothetical protein SYNPS1DRAFT_28540 [Syncephalis pseudoplumigaleata]
MTASDTRASSSVSCQLLDVLTTFPFTDPASLLSLLGHIDLLRLSACCRSLRSRIRGNNALWQQLHERAFLFGAYRDKEWEFVLWCLRTDAGDGSAPIRRADLLEKDIDWYGIYRRRLTTENNWRHDRSATTSVDVEVNQSKRATVSYFSCTSATAMVLRLCHSIDGVQTYPICSLEFSAHPDLAQAAHTTRDYTFATAPNIILRHGGDRQYRDTYYPLLGDHYMVLRHMDDAEREQQVVTISARGHTSSMTTLSLPATYMLREVNKKWAFLADDLELSSKEGRERQRRFEWALYRCTGNGPARQLRSGWFYLPALQYDPMGWTTYRMGQQQMVLSLSVDKECSHEIVHSIASAGQSTTPQYKFCIAEQGLSIPLLKQGLRCLGDENTTIYCSTPYDDSQFVRIPDTFYYEHVIGSLFCVFVFQQSGEQPLLFDIDKREIIRALNSVDRPRKHCMLGTVSQHAKDRKQHSLVIHEYGAL